MVKEKNVDFNVIANHLTMGGFDTQPLMALTPLPSVIRRYHIIAYLGSCSGQLRFEQFPMFQKVVSGNGSIVGFPYQPGPPQRRKWGYHGVSPVLGQTQLLQLFPLGCGLLRRKRTPEFNHVLQS